MGVEDSVTFSMDELYGPDEKPTSSAPLNASRPLMGAGANEEQGRPPAGMTLVQDEVQRQAGCVAPLPTRVRILPYESPQYICCPTLSYVVAVTGGSSAFVPMPSVPAPIVVVRLPVTELPHTQSVVSELQLTLRMRLTPESPTQPALPVGSISSAVVVNWKVESSPLPFAQPIGPVGFIEAGGPPPMTRYMAPVT